MADHRAISPNPSQHLNTVEQPNAISDLNENSDQVEQPNINSDLNENSDQTHNTSIHESDPITSAQPSLHNPTVEFLHSLTKPQLQKHCRELGIQSVWVKKDALIDLIMRGSQHSPRVNPSTPSQPGHPSTESVSDLQSTPPSDFELLSAKIDKLTVTITKIGERVCGIDERVAGLETRVNINHDPSQIRLPDNPPTQTDAITQQIQFLEHRISTLEERLNANAAPKEDNHHQQLTTPQQVRDVNTLIIGDGNLTDIRKSDLTKPTAIRTIHEADIDLLKCWVHEILSWSPDKCIIYGGFYDALESKPPTALIDQLSTLVSELKHKNENMEICIIQIAPTRQCEILQAKINELNEHIQKWADDNSILTVDPSLSFKLGTGEIDESCYYTQEHQTLNRTGVIRLISAITRKHPDFNECFDWDRVKKTTNNLHTSNQQFTSNSPNVPRDQEGWQVVSRRRTTNPRPH